MWTVVLDTTAIVADFRLRSAPMLGLVERAAQRSLRLVVPEVVVREAIAKYGQHLAQLESTLSKASTLAGRLGLSFEPAPIQHAAEVEGYSQMLRARLREIGAEMPEPPDTPHLTLIDRAVSRTKPFVESGAGYRDALIWESVLACARSSDVAFITSNSSDFADRGDEVSLVCSDLRRDLFRLGESEDRVIVCRNPAAAVEHLFMRDERLRDVLNRQRSILANDLINLLPPVLVVGRPTELGIPANATIFGVTNLEPVDEDEYAEDQRNEDDRYCEAAEVVQATHIGDALAMLRLQVLVRGTVEFSMPGEMLLDGGFQADAEMMCAVERTLRLHAITIYDTAANCLTSVEPIELVPCEDEKILAAEPRLTSRQAPQP